MDWFKINSFINILVINGLKNLSIIIFYGKIKFYW